MTPIWQRLGDRAIRFPRGRGNPAAVIRAIRGWPHVIDVVVAHEDIAVVFDREPADLPPAVAPRATRRSRPAAGEARRVVAIDPAWIAALDDMDADIAPVRDHTLRCIYDGEDLESVARACGLTVAEVIDRHCAVIYTVETMGFLPGFGYLAGLDRRLELPRRATPRPRVPALSVAIAGRHTAVYPFDSPGGWHLIGRVPDPMFDAAGARLGLGDRVRFSP